MDDDVKYVCDKIKEFISKNLLFIFLFVFKIINFWRK
jgi:hypothetical protein